jgi:hypothetical protein
MSDFTYLRDKYCTCCTVRLNKLGKNTIRHINDEKLVMKLNSVKNTILEKKKIKNDNIIKIGDIICGRCRQYANKYGTTVSPTAENSGQPESDRIYPDLSQMILGEQESSGGSHQIIRYFYKTNIFDTFNKLIS